jgi:ribonucleoside-triphosphate reductase
MCLRKGIEMDLAVIKRDGSREAFNPERIVSAVSRAAAASGVDDDSFCKEIAEGVGKELSAENAGEVDITEIQRLVEDQLMASSHKEVARSYIEYRHDRDRARESRNNLSKEIKGLMEQSNVDILNENANKDSKVIPTQRDLLAGIVARHYAKQFMLPRDVVTSHERGEIHFHDLDYSPFFPMFNCMLIDLRGMLEQGFKMGNAEIESPKSITTATAVTAQIIAQVASHIYGGTTINRIDEVLEPYVMKSYEKNVAIAKDWNVPDHDGYARARTEKECYDAFQALEYEINTLHTANGQTPFVTLGFGLGTSWASRLIQQSILKNRMCGLGKNHRTAVFPKLVFAIKDGVNHKKGDPNYDIKQLALKCASERMYPDILNYEQVVRVTGSFKNPMGCRSFLPKWLNADGVEEIDGRNNLGVVSLNLPRIAIEANHDEKKFYEILDSRLAICKKALICRIKRLDGVRARVAPILYMAGACGVRLKADDPVAPIFKNGRASVSLGYIGINECMNALYGDTPVFENEELREKAIRIVKYLHDACVKWREETGYGFSLYGTPAENLCKRFCVLDQREFGIIKGVTDKGYYTNSFHLDVQYKTDPYSKIDFESPYPELSSGGFICYAEFPNMRRNLEALEDVWDYTYDKIPYFGTNTPIDQCFACGYKGEFECTSKGFVCPNCGCHDPSKVSVIRRVCGYLGAPDARPFNNGKQEEVKRRVKHLG